jgi:ribosomal protein S18 acetylase RimI-like enzyme
MSAKPVYRFMHVDDVAIYRELRLRGLKEHPESFLESYEDAIKWPLKRFERFFENGWIIGAFIKGELKGMSGLYRHRGSKVAHKGTVWGVYVTPEARGHGIARTAITMLIDEAVKAGIEQVHLSTDMHNQFTVSLYKDLGFEECGTEKHILKLPDKYVDDLLMVKFLSQQEAA